MDGQTPRKRSITRKLVRGLVALAALGVVTVAFLPWLAGFPPARRAIVSAINGALRPSRVEVGGLALSWFGSNQLTGLSVTDPRGKILLNAKRVVLDRGLVALLFDRSHLGTLTVKDAAVDVERRADGSIDLVDAFSRPTSVPSPASTPKPGGGALPELTLKVVNGSLRLATPELAEPLLASRMDLDVRLPSAAGKTLTVKLRLSDPPSGTGAEALGVDITYDPHATVAPNLTLAIKGERWPIAVTAGGFLTRGRLDGALQVARAAGLWSSSGDAKLLNLDARGPALSGDRLAFDALSGSWDLAQGEAAWMVRKLGLICPAGSLSANGILANGPNGPAPDARFEGRLDLAALSRQVPHVLRLREGLTLDRGSARIVAQVRAQGDDQQASLEASLSDISARDAARTFTLRNPAVVTAHASRDKAGVKVETLEVKTPFLAVSGSGDLDAGVKLVGTLDLAAIEAQCRDLIDFGALTLTGKGRMAADFRKARDKYVGRYAAEVRGLQVAGLTAQPIVRDALRFDAAVNGPADPSGAPLGWENLKVNLKSTVDAVTLAARLRDGVTSVDGTASLPISVNAHEARADAKLVGRWSPGKSTEPSMLKGVIDFDQLRLGLRPTDPRLAGAEVALAVRGRLDLDGDNLSLASLPLPEGTHTPLVLSPVGLSLHGLRKTPLSEYGLQAEFVGDLAALDQALSVWESQEPRGLGGGFLLQLGMGPENGKVNLGMNLKMAELTRAGADGTSRTSEGPVAVAFHGAYDPGADRLACESMALITRYGEVDASGFVDAPRTNRVADLTGMIAPNWQTVTLLAAASVEPKAQFDGKSRPFHVKGPLSGNSLAMILKGLDAELGVELTSAVAFGLTLGPAPVVVRSGKGGLTIDPIMTTLNKGKVVLRPGLSIDDVKGIALTLAKGSAIDGAEINDEVSRRVLRYVAPVLNEATQVHGLVHLNVDAAEFPLTGPPEHKTSMSGQLAFQDVTFAPGPFAREMLSLVGKTNSPGLRLQQPLQLTVADGRVTQKGLEVPISQGAKITLEGSVGFDETLDLRARVPITRGMLGSNPGLDELVGNNVVTLPIGGTVSHPDINRRALQVALGELSRNVLKRGLSREAEGLMNRIAPPAARGNGPGNPGGDLRGLENQLLRRVLPGGSNP